jgi:FkbM family methyltransferase
MHYKSQSGQDSFLNEKIFKNKKYGTFIDVGAYDGIRFSNTWFFEKILQWTGICIEPNPLIFPLLQKNRNCLTFNIAVSNIEKEIDFTLVDGPSDMLSGISSLYDKRHYERIQKEICELGGNIKNIKINSNTLKNIIEISKIKYFDFCSIDVEGGELEVLKSIDFSKVKINYFVIENNFGTNDVENFLIAKNYKKISKEADDIYELQEK